MIFKVTKQICLVVFISLFVFSQKANGFEMHGFMDVLYNYSNSAAADKSLKNGFRVRGITVS